MNGLSPLDLYNQLMHGYTKVSISIEHIRAMRPMVFRRVLSMQKVFQLTIPGFGKVEYTPQDNIGVKRGYSYDILPDPADPREPALIYDGAKFMGEASYKYHTPYLSETAGKEISKKRNSDLREANAAAKALKQRIKQAESPLIVSNEGLSGLLQSNLLDVLKLPKEKPPEPEEIIQVQQDGSFINTQTGDITKCLERPIFTDNPDKREAEERERKLKEMNEKAENERLAKLFRRQPE